MRFVWLSILLLLPAGAFAQTAAELVPGLREQVIRPAADAHRARVAELDASIDRVCAAPDATALERPREAFRAAMTSWQRLAPLVQGPLGDANLAARVLFWPDKHGTASRQLAKALASRDQKLTTSRGVAGASAALGGLGALELLLWGDPPPLAGGGFACDYARAIVAVQSDAAQRASNILDAPRDLEDEAQGLLITARNALDLIVQRKLGEPLGDRPEEARGTRAEGWRSGSSLANLRANLETVRALIVAPGGLAQAAIGGPESQATAIVVERRLTKALADVDAVPLPLDRAVADQVARPAVETLAQEVDNLRTLIVERLGPALGLATGFNATDGD